MTEDKSVTSPDAQNIGPMTNDSGIVHSPEISGKWVVLAMLLFGIIAATTLFVYWDLHTKPFRPLREAIGREFRHSRPNVEGGRQKGRGPWTLRISMTVEFPPAEEDEKSKKIFDRVLELSQQYHPLNEIEKSNST